MAVLRFLGIDIPHFHYISVFTFKFVGHVGLSSAAMCVWHCISYC